MLKVISPFCAVLNATTALASTVKPVHLPEPLGTDVPLTVEMQEQEGPSEKKKSKKKRKKQEPEVEPVGSLTYTETALKEGANGNGIVAVTEIREQSSNEQKEKSKKKKRKQESEVGLAAEPLTSEKEQTGGIQEKENGFSKVQIREETIPFQGPAANETKGMEQSGGEHKEKKMKRRKKQDEMQQVENTIDMKNNAKSTSSNEALKAVLQQALQGDGASVSLKEVLARVTGADSKALLGQISVGKGKKGTYTLVV